MKFILSIYLLLLKKKHYMEESMKTTYWSPVFVNYQNNSSVVARAKLCYNYYSEPIQTFINEHKKVLALKCCLLFIYKCIETSLMGVGL